MEIDVDLAVNKVAAVAVIVVADTLFTALPLMLTSFKRYAIYLQLFNSCAAGLMMGMSVLELLNDDGEDDVGRTKTMSFVVGGVFVLSFLFSLFLHFYMANRRDMLTFELAQTPQKTLGQILLLRMRANSSPSLGLSTSSSVREEPEVDMNVRLREIYRLKIGEEDKGETQGDEGTKRGLFFWTMATAFESFFSCVVLGCQTDDRLVWVIFVAIVAGDWPECVVLGQKIHQHFRFSSLCYQLAIVLSLQVASGLGFAVGLVANLLTPHVQETVSQILFAMLSGVFFYISVIDMIMRELYAEPLTRRKFAVKCGLVYAGLFVAIGLNVSLSSYHEETPSG